MIRTVRTYIAVAAISLLGAALVHLGILMQGYRHREAGIAEGVIGIGMLVGLALTWLPGPKSWSAAVASLAFGLVGTLVGVFTIVIGVGPQTVPDVVYHIALLAVLSLGLIAARRARDRVFNRPRSSEEAPLS